MNKKLSLIASFILCFGAACSPVKDTISPNRVEVLDLKPLPDVAGWFINVHVLDVTDARDSQELGEIEGRLLYPSGNVPRAVQAALEDALRKKGIHISLFDAPGILAKVMRWRVDVVPGFPFTKMFSEARIGIEILDINGKRVYNAEYSGEYTKEYPSPGQETIENVLGMAMAHAIREALEDSQGMLELKRVGGR